MKRASPSKSRFGWLVAGLLCAGVLSGIAFAREVLRSRQIDAEIRTLKQESDRLQVRNFQLSSIEASLQNGEYLEREARLKLGLRRDGEQVVVLKKPTGAAEAGGTAGMPGAAEAGGWSNARKWWTLFVDPKAYEAYAAARKRA